MPRAVVFDLDGTLVDSAPDLRAALNATLAELGRRAIGLEETKTFTGDGVEPLLAKALVATGTPLVGAAFQAALQRFLVQYAAQDADPAQIFPGIVALLHDLQGRGVPLALCTNKITKATTRLLRQLELAAFFGAVVCGDTLDAVKPDPRPLLHVAQLLGTPPSSCVMVGDSPNDGRAAHDAGMPCVLVRYGYTSVWPDDLRAGPFVDDVPGLRRALMA